MNVLIAILGLAALVLVHEAGHFFTALAVRMRPRKFYIGFPPAVLKVKKNGIEYGLGAIPLGGYVRIPGMHRPASRDVDAHLAPARAEAPELTVPLERLKRALNEDDYAKADEEVAALADRLDQMRLSAGALRAANRGIQDLRDSLGPDAYWRQRTWKRVLVIAAGPATNILFALILFTALYLVAGGPATSRVSSIRTDFPAAAAGLTKGDKIVTINSVAVTPDTIATEINGSHGRPLTLEILRQGHVLHVGPVRPKRDVDGVYRLGFVLDRQGLSFPTAAWRSVRLTGLVTQEVGKSLGRLVTGSGRKEISSPVGIVQGSTNALDEGMERYLWVLGLLSLSLALLNLLPLLPLDGGHIVFSIVEGIRGRAVGRAVYERVSAVGLAVVLLLFFVGLSNDIGRLGQ